MTDKKTDVKFKITPVDSEKEKDGVWADYFGVELLIGRANSPEFRKLFSSLCRPFFSQPGIVSYEQIPVKDQTAIMIKTISETLLFDWKKTERFNYDYSKDMAVTMLEADPDCLKFISEYANNMANYYAEEMEELSAK